MTHPIEEAIAYPTVVYYNDDHSNTPTCTDAISEQLKTKWTLPETWQQLVTELEAGNRFLAFHINMVAKSMHSTPIEFIDAITTMAKFIPNAKNLALAVIITPETPLSVIRTLQKTQVQGILLDIKHYPIEDVCNAINALVNNIPYWPKEIINKLPGNVLKTNKSFNITLTTRQEQVFKLITERGSSNKVIAKALGISESTVKLHVTEIFKKYGVRSRTQLAVFSNIS